MKFVMEIEIKKIKRLGNWVDGIMLEMVQASQCEEIK